MNTPINAIKVKAASGTATLSDVRIFRSNGACIAGASGAIDLTGIGNSSWSSLTTLLSSYQTGDAFGVVGIVGGAALQVCAVDNLDTTEGSLAEYQIGQTVIFGSVPDFYADGLGGQVAVVSANFTRPNDTTAYAASDLVANSTTAGSVAPMQFSVGRSAGATGMVRRARIKKSGANTGTFRLHLFKTSPTVTNGDNGAFLPNNSANYVGALAVNADRVFSDGVVGGGVPLNGSEMNFVLPAASTVLYGLLEATVATTPAAQEIFTLELEVIRG